MIPRHSARRTLLAAGALALLLPACRKDETVPVDLGYAYFPVQQGAWAEYLVDSSWSFESIGISGSLRYRLREVIDSVYTDPEGRTAQRIERFVWDTLTNDWRIKDVWTQTRQSTYAERTEEDVRLLKLTFPVKVGERWNLNTFNSQRDMEVGYDVVDMPWQHGNTSFDSTVLVRNYYPNNLVDTLIYRERYAKHIGLVERIRDTSNTQVSGTNGWYFRQVITAHGN
ncbi:MAG TPA: hypothetical protein PLH93_01360 [Flavobacteriales bacterium]|jgi:hypothetical protein|nr:hypothetical protein [Flavobacteriales bacterium]HQW85796.1 hypothetical protein [Flavobacteriales bacterium]